MHSLKSPSPNKAEQRAPTEEKMKLGRGQSGKARETQATNTSKWSKTEIIPFRVNVQVSIQVHWVSGRHVILWVAGAIVMTIVSKGKHYSKSVTWEAS
eukprot:4500066-Amphidinium_carterae.1